MKTMRIVSICGILLFIAAGVLADISTADRRALLSRVHSMSHGYFSEREWDAVFQRLNELRVVARSEGRPEEVVELNLLEAMILSDMRRAPDRAIQLLEGTIKEYFGQPVHNLRRAYVQLAELHAQRGDENAIVALIKEFQESPHFDPVAYPFTGGARPDDPLVVTRPRAQGPSSVTITAMQRFQKQARLAPGRLMPDLQGVDMNGRSMRLSDLRGRVVLVDFWFPESLAWRRELPNVLSAYQQYRPAGFEIIGVPLGRDEAAVLRYSQRHAMTWPQWQVGRTALADIGIFGDARSVLVNADGVIIAQDLRGTDLAVALRGLLP